MKKKQKRAVAIVAIAALRRIDERFREMVDWLQHEDSIIAAALEREFDLGNIAHNALDEIGDDRGSDLE